MKRLVIFDLDGTITKKDTYLAFLIQTLVRRPSRFVPALWLPLAVVMHKLKVRDNSWLKVAFLRTIAGGLPRGAVALRSASFVEKTVARSLRPGASQALKMHQGNGDRVMLVSASFDFYVELLARQLGIAEVICTRSLWRNEMLASGLDGPNCYGPVKIRKLEEYLGDQRRDHHIVVYTDHHSDSGLLDFADEAIAVNPDRKLRRHCELKGYRVVDWNSVAG